MTDTSFCEPALQSALERYRRFAAAYANPTRIPRSFTNGAVHLVAPSDWTSGFVAGSFWYLYEYSGDPALRHAAEAFTAALAAVPEQTDTHDVGFMLCSSYGHGLRLAGHDGYADALIRGARSLASRFDPVVGATRSWSFGRWTFPVIVDNMMNLELLFRAARLSGDRAYAELAVRHALTTLREHFRADFSSYHLVDFDPRSGAVLHKGTHQGLFDESCWARGQAWGLYGFTMCHRETENERFLAHALAIADFLVECPAIPADGVPYFDFSAPATDGVPPLRDASAAAITASALLELQRSAPPERAARYRDHALRILRTLSSPEYCAAPGENGHFVLMHGVGDYPRGHEVDAALNYADYYYIEALLRARSL